MASLASSLGWGCGSTTGNNQSEAIKPLPGLIGTGAGLIGNAPEWETPLGLGPKAPPSGRCLPPGSTAQHRCRQTSLGERLLQTDGKKRFVTSSAGAPGTRFTHRLQQPSSCIFMMPSDLCRSHSVVRALRGGSVSCSCLDPPPLRVQHVLQALRSVGPFNDQ